MQLPYTIIVDTPGKYRTRSGLLVLIFAIVPGSSFPCKGYLIKPDAIGRNRRHFNSWALDGRIGALAGRSSDIIAKV